MTKVVTAKQMRRPAMSLALAFQTVQSPVLLPSEDARIRAFLAGETDGEDVLHEIYDDVLDEPIPESMRALLKR
ncbi:MAG TPA: hypothetical protein VHU15_07965 [Stellaceae bacterium]|nr:hypothetical protein [Stellaceae bacterium]